MKKLLALASALILLGACETVPEEEDDDMEQGGGERVELPAPVRDLPSWA